MAKSVNGWDKDKIQKLLLTNSRAVEKAMVVVFNNQTRTEQSAESTLESNGIGFTGAHAHMGSYYAKWVLSGKHLSGKHLEKARKMALKYHRQLIAAIPVTGE